MPGAPLGRPRGVRRRFRIGILNGIASTRIGSGRPLSARKGWRKFRRVAGVQSGGSLFDIVILGRDARAAVLRVGTGTSVTLDLSDCAVSCRHEEACAGFRLWLGSWQGGGMSADSNRVMTGSWVGGSGRCSGFGRDDGFDLLLT
jgi:hypothetical protein